jgi:hypothetical protein
MRSRPAGQEGKGRGRPTDRPEASMFAAAEYRVRPSPGSAGQPAAWRRWGYISRAM